MKRPQRSREGEPHLRSGTAGDEPPPYELSIGAADWVEKSALRRFFGGVEALLFL